MLLTLSLPLGALADGTPAGTIITNTVSLDFQVNGEDQTQVSNDVTFTVDRKLDVLVDEVAGDYIAVTPAATVQVMVFTVTNQGNAVQDFLVAHAQLPDLTADPFGNGDEDNFDAASISVFVETTGSPTAGYDHGDDTDTGINDLAIDATINVYVVATIPNIQAQDDIAVVSLTATVLAADGTAYTGETGPSGGEDIVYTDDAGYGGDAARNRAHADAGAFQVDAPTMNVTKSATVIDDGFGNFGDFDNAHALPGATIEYIITANNTGSTAASNVLIVDTLSWDEATSSVVDFTDFIAGSVNLTGAATATSVEYATDNPPTNWAGGYIPANNVDGVDPNVTGIRITCSSVAAADGDQVIRFRVVIE